MSGGATDAQRVFRGKRSPGHMGAARATVRNLELVRIKPFGEQAAEVEEPEVLEQAQATMETVAENTVEQAGQEPEQKAEKKKKESKTSKSSKYIVAVKGAVPGKRNSLVIIENNK